MRGRCVGTHSAAREVVPAYGIAVYCVAVMAPGAMQGYLVDIAAFPQGVRPSSRSVQKEAALSAGPPKVFPNMSSSSNPLAREQIAGQ